jgi:hypothetical protein
VPATDTPVEENCAFAWATQSLPDLTKQVQEALDQAGLTDVRARAEAYGENCISSITNKVVSFGAMETDYHFTTQVADLKDADALGTLVEKMLVVLDQFPVGSTPGPRTGYVGVHFLQNGEELNLWFQADTANAARNEGLHGRALLDRSVLVGELVLWVAASGEHASNSANGGNSLHPVDPASFQLALT